MGVDFSNYQVFCGDNLQLGRRQLIDQIHSAMLESGMVSKPVSRSQVDYILQTERTTRCFGVGPEGKWITVLDSLSSVYGEPHFCHERGDYFERESVVPLEPDLEAELQRQEDCKAFLKSISKGFPSMWLQVLDGMGIAAQLYSDGREVGAFKYPARVNGVVSAETNIEDDADWPDSARLPSHADGFGQRDPSQYWLENHVILAEYIGWHPDSVTLGFTVDHEGTDWDFSVPHDYELLLFDRIS